MIHDQFIMIPCPKLQYTIYILQNPFSQYPRKLKSETIQSHFLPYMLAKKQTKNSGSDQIINSLKPEPSWSPNTDPPALNYRGKPSFQRFDSRTIMMFVDNKIKIPAALYDRRVGEFD